MGNVKVSDYKKALRYIDRLETTIKKTQEGMKVLFKILSEMDRNMESVLASKNNPEL